MSLGSQRGRLVVHRRTDRRVYREESRVRASRSAVVDLNHRGQVVFVDRDRGTMCVHSQPTLVRSEVSSYTVGNTGKETRALGEAAKQRPGAGGTSTLQVERVRDGPGSAHGAYGATPRLALLSSRGAEARGAEARGALAPLGDAH
ncbi:hypothetical protein KUCAC02_037136 [Chaenocephalus aceratus]|nr:hypothetical protein KUCAC02_037136 [Chaenocephalus aceratus]